MENKNKNIYIVRSASATNTDSMIKTGQATVELRNGDIVELGNKVKGVYEIKPAKKDSKLIGIVYNADVATQENYRGLTDDPRDVSFKPGTSINFYIPEKYDEIAITVASGTPENATHLVLDETNGGYAFSSDVNAETGSIVYQITENKFISVGNERIKTIEAICVLV